MAQQQREQAARKRLAAQMAQRRLDAPPQTGASRSALDNMAYNIHRAYDWGGHEDQACTVVVKKPSGAYVLFAQRFMTAMEAYARHHYGSVIWRFKPGGGPHLHAEMYAVLNYLQKHGGDPAHSIAEIGVSKPICADCEAILHHLGIVYNTAWTSGQSTTHWLDPWRLLPKGFTPAVDPPDVESDDEAS
jgi:hypothetical protein